MDTPQPNPLPGIRTLAKDMALKTRPHTASDSTSEPKKKPAPALNFVDDGEKNVYKAPNEIKDVSSESDKKIENEVIQKKKPVVIKPSHEPKPKSLSESKTVSEPKIIVDNEDAESAVIIRDTKHNRFHLFPAIGNSLKLWFAEIKERYFTKKAPKYTVPEASRRKGVIQRATSKTGKLTTFDRTSLQERIRERQERTVPKTPTTTWSANTEPGFLLLEDPDEQPISNVKIVPRKSFRTTPPEPKPVEVVPLPPKPVSVSVVKETPIIEASPEPKPVAVVPPPPVQVEFDSTPAVPVVRTLATDAAEPQTNLVGVTTDTPRDQTVGVTKIKPQNLRDWLFSINTNFISLGVVGLVTAVTFVVIVGYTWFSGQSQNLSIITTPNYPTLLSVPLQTLYIDDPTKENLFTQIIQNQKQSQYETLQIGLITSPTGEALLSPTKILSMLDSSVGTVFSRSINTIYFGSVNQSIPFVVMKTTDSNTAKGGMLAWEGSMYESLLPLFSAFNPNLTKPSDTLKFSDIVVNGVDARALSDDQNNEPILIYALTKQNILIITTNQKTLTELFTLIP